MAKKSAQKNPRSHSPSARKKTRKVREQKDKPLADRFAGEPRVFRFWQDTAGCLAFAGGEWRGEGVHGDPERDGEYKWARLTIGPRGLALNLLTARPVPPRRGLWALFASRRRRPVAGGKQEDLEFPAGDMQADVDVLQVEHGRRRAELQGIDEKRCYLVLRDTGPDGRIEFAGVLARV